MHGAVLAGGAAAAHTSSTLPQRGIAYVEEDDTLLPGLTVREMVHYSAQLKRAARQSPWRCEAFADHVVERLGLSHCQHVRIGSTQWRCASPARSRRNSTCGRCESLHTR